MAIKRSVNELAYSFIKYEDTDEVHIFEGRFTTERCTANHTSICSKIEDRRAENMVNVITCLNEDEARLKAAEIGRTVCGVCISHLYTTYKK